MALAVHFNGSLKTSSCSIGMQLMAFLFLGEQQGISQALGQNSLAGIHQLFAL